MKSRYLLWTAGMCFLAACGSCVGAIAQEVPEGLVKNLTSLPAQPGEDTWKFVADLQSPLWNSHGWSPRAAASGEVNLWGGVSIDAQFPDHKGLLKTALSWAWHTRSYQSHPFSSTRNRF